MRGRAITDFPTQSRLARSRGDRRSPHGVRPSLRRTEGSFVEQRELARDAVTCPLQAAATLFSHGTRIRYTEAASHGSSRCSRPWRTGPSSPNAALRVIRNHDRSRPTPPGQSSLLPLAPARRVVLATRSEPGRDPTGRPARLHVDRGRPTTTPRVVGALRGPGARTTLIRDWNSRFIVLCWRPPNFPSEDPSARSWPQRFAWDMGGTREVETLAEPYYSELDGVYHALRSCPSGRQIPAEIRRADATGPSSWNPLPLHPADSAVSRFSLAMHGHQGHP
jgi:hypothetical protein